MPAAEPDLQRIASVLEKHQVQCVLIGGMAVFLVGGETPTSDVDLSFSRDSENLNRLADALEELNARPKRWRTGKFRLQQVDVSGPWLHMESDAGDIDLIAIPPGVTYEELASTSHLVSLGATSIKVASIEALLDMKSGTSRERDARHVRELEAIRELNGDGDDN